MESTPSPEDTLCRQCGLCCDGHLFADVRLRNEEVPPIESTVGYERRSDAFYLQQPCLAFCDGDCKVYSQRPKGCREFECHLLKAVKEFTLPEYAALELIKEIKRKIESVEQLLVDLGEADEMLPLSLRIEAVLSEAWDLSESEHRQEKREALFQESTTLEGTLEAQFRADS